MRRYAQADETPAKSAARGSVGSEAGVETSEEAATVERRAMAAVWARRAAWDARVRK